MKSFMLNLKHQITTHPYFSAFCIAFSSLVEFVLKSWSINIILLLFLFVSIGINTLSGVKLAKQKGEYDPKILREKFTKKAIGYIISLASLWVLIMMFYLSLLMDDKPLISVYYLNIPMMTVFLFYSGVEFLSTSENVKAGYGITMPSSVTDRVKTFVDSGGKEPDKLLKNN